MAITPPEPFTLWYNVKTSKVYLILPTVATHSENLEELVHYVRLYPKTADEKRIWARPVKLFFEKFKPIYQHDVIIKSL
jgi:hypothetical protein